MGAAYGLSITFTMLMTTILFCTYLLFVKQRPFILVAITALTYFTIEGSFLVANLLKFRHGGYVTIIIGIFLFIVMWVWFKARKIKNRYLEFVDVKDYLDLLNDLSNDESVPKFATHLVYLTSADYPSQIESKVFYSIFNKRPKRADMYWFLHVDVVDEPYRMEYSVRVLKPDVVIRVDFRLGFRIAPRINLFFKKVVENMVANHEIDITSRYESLSKQHLIGDFQFVVIEKFLSYDNELPFGEKVIMDIYFFLKSISLKEGREFGLDSDVVTIEKFPLLLTPPKEIALKRTYE